MIFTTARPHNAGLCGMELLAQVRPNGRILDHYRVSLCRRQPYPRCQLQAGWAAPLPHYGRASLQIQCVAQSRGHQEEHVDFRLVRCLRSHGLQESLRDWRGEPAHPIWQDSAGDQGGRQHGRLRFAVVAGEDAKMQLLLQCLPGSANSLMGRPLLRG